MYAPEKATFTFIQAADAAGYAVHFHAIGDRSVRTAVDAIAAVTPPGTTVNRHSMTHLQLVSDQDISRLGDLKVPARRQAQSERIFPDCGVLESIRAEQLEGYSSGLISLERLF